MKKYKTVGEVITIGQLVVNVPVAIIMFSVPIILVFGILKLFPDGSDGIGILLGVFGGIGLGFILAWTWWSFSIVKWRIWAFENTKKSDWRTLKRRAINEKLIWKDRSKFEKTEIRNEIEKKEIEKINSEIKEIEKNDTLEIVKDDPRIPGKMDFYFKKSETVGSLILSLFFMGLGTYLLMSDMTIYGLLAIVMGIYVMDLNKIKNIKNPEAQLILSNEGIEVKKFKQFGLVEWENTQDIRVDLDKGILQLGIWVNEKNYQVKSNLSDYQIGDYAEFLRIINVYLKRNSEKK